VRSLAWIENVTFDTCSWVKVWDSLRDKIPDWKSGHGA